MGEYHMKDNTKDNNMKDVLNIYFHIKAKLENAPSLHQFFYHGWLHTKYHYDAVCYLAVVDGIVSKIVDEHKIEDEDDIDYLKAKVRLGILKWK